MSSSDPFFLILLLVMCVIPFQGIIRATPSGELQACLLRLSKTVFLTLHEKYNINLDSKLGS